LFRLFASRVEKIGKASLRDAAIGTGIAVDKMLALTGQMPTVQIANLVMPTEEERAKRRQIHAKLDEIARRDWPTRKGRTNRSAFEALRSHTDDEAKAAKGGRWGMVQLWSIG
jgi:hypothetical protein